MGGKKRRRGNDKTRETARLLMLPKGDVTVVVRGEEFGGRMGRPDEDENEEGEFRIRRFAGKSWVAWPSRPSLRASSPGARCTDGERTRCSGNPPWTRRDSRLAPRECGRKCSRRDASNDDRDGRATHGIRRHGFTGGTVWSLAAPWRAYELAPLSDGRRSRGCRERWIAIRRRFLPPDGAPGGGCL
jgi:hypothetical protein